MENTFSELPQAMIAEMLTTTTSLTQDVTQHVAKMQSEKDDLRRLLEGQIRQDSDLIDVQRFPTTAGVDGSFCSDKMLTTDFVAMAAVCVEGLTPPKQSEPLWKLPRHFVNISSIRHDNNTAFYAKAIMLAMELQLADTAPHNVVFLDGSMTTPCIALNQALNNSTPQTLHDYLLDGDTTTEFGSIKNTLSAYANILKASRSDNLTVALPKYTVKNEICQKLGKSSYDDRGLLSILLRPGEYITPFKFEHGRDALLRAEIPTDAHTQKHDVNKYLQDLYVVYYKPKEYFPAIRIEMSSMIATNKSRLAVILEAIKNQSGFPGLMEPYPNYIADRFVKRLSIAIPALKGVSVSDLMNADSHSSDVYLSLHSYRTEAGK